MATDYAEKERIFIASLSGETGRDLAEWMKVIQNSNLQDRNDIIDWLREQGFPFARASWLERIHHNQPLEALSKMSFAILQTVVRKLERRYGRALLDDVNRSMKLIRYAGGNYYLDVEEIAELDRPPMIDLADYVNRERVS